MGDPIDEWLRAATIEERASVVTGATMWSTRGIPRLEVAGMRLTDGPNGARGPRFTGPPSRCFPCGSALGATWDPGLLERVGRVLAEEARRKGAHVLLAPTVNLHRHPLAGRSFECFSEDPILTARLAVAFVRGVQSGGIGAAVKHFVANDQEHERMTIDVDVDERTLRELHLVPFEAVVRDADVAAVMAAYNRVGGVHCSEHRWLLTKVLREEWGFSGAVISDWFGTHSTEGAANAGLDLEMPGPPKWFGDALARAVHEGNVTEATLTEMARRVLALSKRTGALDGAGNDAPTGLDDPAERALAREAASASFVLLKNDDAVLPLDHRHRRIAIIGAAADMTWIMGGGSAEVVPHDVLTPLQAIRRALDGVAEVAYARGPFTHRTLPDLDARSLVGGKATIAYFDGCDLAGPVVRTEEISAIREVWIGRWTDMLDPSAFSARIEATLSVSEPGDWTIGLTTTGPCRVLLDDRIVIDAWSSRPAGDSFFGFGSAELRATIRLEDASRHALTVEWASGGVPTPRGVAVKLAPPNPPDAMERAVARARDADVAIVVVGTGPAWEQEGRDREAFGLPAAQDALVRAVAAANPRTVVCVNAGAPVALDFSDEVAAVLQCWLPGEAWGHALADVLLGAAEPGGRLPVTIPRRLEDTPAFGSYPGAKGRAAYDEGVLLGYRWYDTHRLSPQFCFGYGLGYTTFAYAALRIDGMQVSVDVTNDGPRTGSEVVQLYIHDVHATVSRPEQELRAFAKVLLLPGEKRACSFTLSARDLAFFRDGRWEVEPGRFEVRVGASSRDIRLRAILEHGGTTQPV